MTETTTPQPPDRVLLDPADQAWVDEEWWAAGDPARVELEAMLEQLANMADVPEQTPAADATRVDQLALLERIKGAAAGLQARITRGFEASQLAQQEAAGVPARRLGRGIGDQVALARGCPTREGARHLGFAHAMVEMPHTDSLLAGGLISEWTATLLVRETACLTREDRQIVDAKLAATTIDTETGEVTEAFVLGLTPRRVEAAARALAVELDAEAVVRRAAKAAKDRRVTTRATPDTMVHVTATVPVVQGVACKASLIAAAKAIKAQGDERTQAQIEADLFVQRLTGQTDADAVPLEVGLVMTPDTLLGAGLAPDRPARTADGTVIPAQTVRDLIHTTTAPVWLRRIFTDPATGVVTHTDPTRRFYDRVDRDFIKWRDQHCRSPLCDGRIDEGDHAERFADGGPTTRENAQGVCKPHNLVKETPGWSTQVTDPRPGRHTTETTTPTGHTYRSQAPPALPPPARE
ncbi:HNH endonuclease signature motif containing protein [Nocardioides ferulae]|uniref:HNH endonuclease signature motif containing protein n=1 Tax=Nocardioides ferulae TaxID=2340821 RepID=UPI000EAD4D02|nr:HNH endonuclease signature motif containing protein [Nocardioides ferulae]